MAKFRYENKNAFPIYLPTPRGGRKQFRPNDYDTNPWYSRFLGRNQLTKTAHDGSLEADSHFVAAPQRRPSTRHPSVVRRQRNGKPQIPYSFDTQVGCTMSCEVLCENVVQAISDTEYGTRIGDRYFCKFCDFDTNDDDKMQEHVETYHEAELAEIEEAD